MYPTNNFAYISQNVLSAFNVSNQNEVDLVVADARCIVY